jgi:hypothetical protein
MPVPAAMRPPKITHERVGTIQKLDDARAGRGPVPGGSIARAGAGGMVDSEGQAQWEEDDVMLFFWGNSNAAKARYRKKVEESTQYMEQWREGVSHVLV